MTGGRYMLNYSWSQDYSVDDPVIDDHHKNLLKLFNDAYSLLVNDEPITETIKLLHELKMYTVFHFSEEEKRMLANNYDGYEKHKEMHEAFIAKVSDLLQKVDVDPRVPVSYTHLIRFIKQWSYYPSDQ